jgi:hypothetical protein
VTILSTAGRTLTSMTSTDEVVASSIPVDLSTNTPVMLMRLIMDPTLPGDIFEVDARARVTNDLTYTVGVGWHLWAFDVDDGVPWPHAQPWTLIGPVNGDNVDHTRHHMPLATTATYQVPANWPAGHRMVIAYQADAHSTAWKTGDKLTVDQAYGLLIVDRWT